MDIQTKFAYYFARSKRSGVSSSTTKPIPQETQIEISSEITQQITDSRCWYLFFVH